MRIVAYAYEAALHCPDCAIARFGEQALADGTARDSEGNDVTPLYSWELGESDACDDCFAELG